MQSQFTSSTAIIAASGASVLADGTTLVRTRGRLQIFLLSGTTAGDGFSGAFGIAVVTLAAFNAGVASIPTPITEQSWDGWLFWQAVQIHTAGALNGGVSTDIDQLGGQISAQTFEIDSKAMRKLRIDDVIVGVMELTENCDCTPT